MSEVICVAPGALEVVREALAKEQNADDLALWLEVNGISNSSYTYDLWFGPTSAIAPGDASQHCGGVLFVVPAQSVERVRGATLDASDRGGETGLVILNPNTPRPVAPTFSGDELTGPLARRVLEVLERDVNPVIAGHRGHVGLVGVEGSIAFVEMSGGCQGCGMAGATLSQGIVIAITDAVAEIREVVDVTDHMSGATPYFGPGAAPGPP
ncbi:MAG: NifU family protein [Acidimicrobiales bacterium]